MGDFGEVMRVTCESQRETQKNLHNTMAAVQNMARDAQTIETAASMISEQMLQLSDRMVREEENHVKNAADAYQAGIELTNKLEELSDSLSLMRIAVDSLTAELNGTQLENRPE